MGLELKMRQLGSLLAIFVVVFVLPFLLAGSIATAKFDWAIPPAALIAVWGVQRAEVGRDSWPFFLGFGLLGIVVTVWLSQDASHWLTAGSSDFWPNVALTVFLIVLVIRTYRTRRASPTRPQPSEANLQER